MMQDDVYNLDRYVRPEARFTGPIHQQIYLSAFVELAELIQMEVGGTLRSNMNFGYIPTNRFYHRLTSLTRGRVEKEAMRVDLMSCLDLVKITAANGKAFLITGPTYRWAERLYAARDSVGVASFMPHDMMLNYLAMEGRLSISNNKTFKARLQEVGTRCSLQQAEDSSKAKHFEFEDNLSSLLGGDLYKWRALNEALLAKLGEMVVVITLPSISLSELKEAKDKIAAHRASVAERLTKQT